MAYPMRSLRINPKKVTPFLLLLFLPFGNYCLAQLNFLTGFSTSFLQNSSLENGVKNYNEVKHVDQLKQDLKPLSNLIGFELGIRSRHDFIAFDAGINMRFQNKTAEGNDLLAQPFTEKFGVRYNTYFLGTELFILSSPISLGANIGYDKFKTKHSTSDQDIDQLIDEQNGWSSKFFLGINLNGSGTTKLVLRPFVHLDWTGKKMDTYLNLLNFSAPSQKIKLNQIGISLVFANGA